MLAPGAVHRLERMQLGASRRLAGVVAGEHRSKRRGDSLDFVDYREYHAGDDVRRIDTSLLARHDVLRIRLFEADDDIAVRVLLDTSASMGVYGKDTAAVDLVAALGIVSLTTGDSFTVVTFPKLEPRRFVGRSAIPDLLRFLSSLTFEGSTDVVQGVRVALGHRGPSGLSVVVSDLLTPEWRVAIDRLPARGSDVIVAHVLSGVETDPDYEGDLSLVDEETRQPLPVSLTTARLATYRERVGRWVENVRGRCLQTRGRYLSVDADRDVVDQLVMAWRTAGVLR